MKALTVSQVSRSLGVSPRMLRHYEQLGLISSFRREDYAYRMYTPEAVGRLRQILILRRLHIPLREIAAILDHPDTATAMEVFLRNIRALDEEREALGAVRDILAGLVAQLGQAAGQPLHLLLTRDSELVAAVRSLALVTLTPKEDSAMEQLKRADKTMGKLTDVRIITLPPCTVAAAHHIGPDPEAHAGSAIHRFVWESALPERKPDLRRFGFNHPNPSAEQPVYGYEAWVTIPPDLEVPPPLQKKRFPGGLYAAHMVTLEGFHQVDWLLEWAMASERYEFAGDLADQEHMCGILEEQLNYAAHALLDDPEPEGMQMDLLLPIRETPR